MVLYFYIKTNLNLSKWATESNIYKLFLEILFHLLWFVPKSQSCEVMQLREMEVKSHGSVPLEIDPHTIDCGHCQLARCSAWAIPLPLIAIALAPDVCNPILGLLLSNIAHKACAGARHGPEHVDTPPPPQFLRSQLHRGATLYFPSPPHLDNCLKRPLCLSLLSSGEEERKILSKLTLMNYSFKKARYPLILNDSPCVYIHSMNECVFLWSNLLLGHSIRLSWGHWNSVSQEALITSGLITSFDLRKEHLFPCKD